MKILKKLKTARALNSELFGRYKKVSQITFLYVFNQTIRCSLVQR